MKSFSIAARINLFLILALLFVVGFSFFSTQNLSKDILYSLSIESLLQRKNVSTKVLKAEEILSLKIDPGQWQKFISDPEIIDLGFYTKDLSGVSELYWVEKTTDETLFNLRSTPASYQEHFVQLGKSYIIYIFSLLLIMTPLVFILSSMLLKPLAELRKISEDVLAGNYDIENISYSANDNLGRTLVALSTLSKNLTTNQLELEKVSELAIRDALTGLKNHRAFKQAIENQLAMVQRYDHLLGIAMLDVDKFKKFNDTYGHQQGDEVLKVVAKTLEEAARTSDFVARYGGEEFVLLFPETNQEGTMMACEKFRKAIEATKVPNINKPGEFLSVTASFGGLSIGPKDIGAPEENAYKKFIEICDKNLYKAKDNGRNCSVVTEKV